MAWRNVKVEDIREYLVRTYLSRSANMKELCDECGVSRKTGYKWVKRYREAGKKGLLDLSRAPKKVKRKFTNEQINLALKMKEARPHFGPKKILVCLQRQYPLMDWPSPTRLYQVFREHHLVCSRKLRRRVPKTAPLGDVQTSNDIWCVDFKGWFETGDKSKVEPLTITDAYSRFLIRCQHLERKRSQDVWKVMSEAFLEFGIPKRVRTDNGPPFASTGAGRLSSLSVNLIKAGVTPEWIEPGHPEENGRHERFHRSLKEAIASPPARNFEEQIIRMNHFIEEYNFDRPHEALNMHVPGNYYSPSLTTWDGKLRSPEYNESEMQIRKVCPNGSIHWKGKGSYVSGLIVGEYVGLKEVDNGYFRVFFGPVWLGNFLEGVGFEKPKRFSR